MSEREREPVGVTITGIGVVSPLGIGTRAFWEALVGGKSAIAPIRGFDPGPRGARLGAQVAELPAREFLPPAQLRRMDRLSQMIGVAGAMAIVEAGLGDARGDELGVVVGSAFGNLAESAQFLERAFRKPSLANPMLFPNLVLNAAASQLAIAFDWRGPNLTVSAGELSGEAALEAGTGLLRRRRARAVVVAAGDELAPVLFRGLKELGVLSPRRAEREWSSPFDEGATGPVAGEGAAALVIEPAEEAARRGARALAAIESARRLAIPAGNPHLWPKPQRPIDEERAGVAVSGADSSPERDELELSLLANVIAGGTSVFAWKAAAGEFGSSGLTGIALAASIAGSGEIPPLFALERPRSGFVAPRRHLAASARSAVVLGTARGGAGMLVRLSA